MPIIRTNDNSQIQQPITTTPEKTCEAASGAATAAKSDAAKGSVIKQYLPPTLTGQDKIDSAGKAALATFFVVTAPVSLLAFAVTTAVIKATATLSKKHVLKAEKQQAAQAAKEEMKAAHDEFKELSKEFEELGGIGVEKDGKVYDQSQAEFRKAPFTKVSEETANFLLSDKTKYTTDLLKKVNSDMKKVLEHPNMEAKKNLYENIAANKRDVPESLASTTKPSPEQVAARAKQANEQLKAELKELEGKKVESKLVFSNQANLSINRETKEVDTKFEKLNIETLKNKETLYKEEFLDGTKVIYNKVITRRPEKGAINDLFNAIRENVDNRIASNTDFKKEEMKQNIKISMKVDSDTIEKLKYEPEKITNQVKQNREAIAKMNDELQQNPNDTELPKKIEDMRKENQQLSKRKNDLTLVLNGLEATSKSIDDLFENPDFLALASKKIESEQTTERVVHEPITDDSPAPKGILRKGNSAS